LAIGDSSGYDPLTQAARMVVENRPAALKTRGQMEMLLEHVLANPDLPSDFPLTKAAATALVLKDFHASPPLLYHLANQHQQQGRFAECARLLERILELGASHSYERSISFHSAIIGDDARLNLGVCYVRMGKINQAKRCFEAIVNSPTRSQQAAQNLKAIAQLGRK
jgi:hypothetical protein